MSQVLRVLSIPVHNAAQLTVLASRPNLRINSPIIMVKPNCHGCVWNPGNVDVDERSGGVAQANVDFGSSLLDGRLRSVCL